MKRTIAWIAAAMLLLGLTGCQKTPENPIVTGKNVDNLIDMATQSEVNATPAASGPDNRAILAAKLGVPERYITDESFSDGSLTLSADAEIVLPNVTALPVLRIKPADFSQEMAGRMYDYLVGDTPMFQQVLRLTKSQIEEDLVGWRQRLSDPEVGEDGKAQAKEQIAILEGAYDGAPYALELTPGDSTLGAWPEINYQTGEVICEYNGVNLAEIPGLNVRKGKQFSIRNNNPDGEVIVTENVGGWTVTDTASQGASFNYYNYDLIEDDEFGAIAETVNADSLTDRPESIGGFSYQDAIDMTQEFLNASGIEDMQISSLTMRLMLPDSYIDTFYGKDTTPSAQQEISEALRNGDYDDKATGVVIGLELTRKVNDIPLTASQGGSFVDSDDMFSKQWVYERFDIEVCSEGIRSVYWISPYEVTETVTEDATLLSFDAIAEVFATMYRVSYDASGSNMAGNVTRVTLSLRRIMEQDNIYSGLFVPVWDFYGSITVSYPEYPGEPPREWMSDEPLLTINAIDGTIIDLDRGY